MTMLDSFAAHNWLKTYMPDSDNNYVRVQTVSDIDLAAIDRKSIADLTTQGQTLYEDNNQEIKKMIKKIVDEKFKQ